MAVDHPGAPRPPHLLRSILIAGLAVGVIDALDAIIVFGVRSGVRPGRIFQGIASGLLGRASFSGGTATVVLGVVLHFTVALGIATTYFLASQRLPFLNRRPWVWGPTYGVAAYAVMNLVVIPLSAIGFPQFNTLGVVNGLLIHAVGIGLPVALLAARLARGPQRSSRA